MVLFGPSPRNTTPSLRIMTALVKLNVPVPRCTYCPDGQAAIALLMVVILAVAGIVLPHCTVTLGIVVFTDWDQSIARLRSRILDHGWPKAEVAEDIAPSAHMAV